ncbi:hypothetical protein BBJ28_00004077 [Nothophytophthora sp. Chile5]|nr:hypothetical protein BBJ28_00004077 [Nothophytophthora sp. Chile5]
MEKLTPVFVWLTQELAERMGRNAAKKFWDFASEDDAVIFAEQLASVVSTHSRLEHEPQIPRIAMHLGPNLSGGKERMILSPNIAGGVMFELHCGTTVPFTLEVAAQAYWKLFAFGPGQRAYQHDVAQAPDTTGDVVARTFALQTDYEGYTSQYRGKVTCRKYVSEDSVIVAWEGAGDVLEMSGVKFHGVQSHKTGWVKLRRVARQGPGQASTSTTVEMYFETTPVFHESVTDLREQTQTFIDATDKGQGKVNKLFCQIVSGMLVEEDWKATYGNEMLGA